MCSDSLPIGCVYPHRLECGFTQDGLSLTFPHGRVAHIHKFVEIPLMLRGHSLGQTKDQVERVSQHHFNMFLEIFVKIQTTFQRVTPLRVELST